jgi:hypothetical protein
VQYGLFCCGSHARQAVLQSFVPYNTIESAGKELPRQTPILKHGNVKVDYSLVKLEAFVGRSNPLLFKASAANPNIETRSNFKIRIPNDQNVFGIDAISI